VSRILAAAGLTTVIIMTAVMLVTADAYLWEYPGWAWAMIWAAAVGLGVNAVAKPRSALSKPAVIVASVVGVVLAWPVTVGGESWWPVWLALGVTMPLLGCWLLRSFSVALRKN